MIQIATFTRKFFIELVKQLQIYGTLYVTEDGNIYVNESQAQTRCQSRTDGVESKEHSFLLKINKRA